MELDEHICNLSREESDCNKVLTDILTKKMFGFIFDGQKINKKWFLLWLKFESHAFR